MVAQTEPELGVGTVLKMEGRTVDVAFGSAGVKRRYAANSPALKRVQLHAGQKAVTRQGHSFVVERVSTERGLLRYEGGTHSILESDLSDLPPDQGLADRFLTGPWSEPRTYDLRCAGWELLGRSLDPDLRGLVGARVSLLPHQLYIAHQVSKREWPRVLLSDEVGLGKTIEAGLIFSTLRALDRATRVLVLAPRPLKHQWLSELYRRFSELFSVVDSDGDKEDSDLDFVSAQKNISSVEFLLSDEHWLELALAEPWDLLIVDEAHHLSWNVSAPSAEWEVVRKLSERSRGLLLLTATPRQQGLETQFGLLHLVDPQRFASFESFQQESVALRSTAQLARRVFEGEQSIELTTELKTKFANDQDVLRAIDEIPQQGPDHLLRALIDRHGTGRVLMRNRRERLQGFPPRRLHSVPLEPATFEARIAWLAGLLAQLAPEEKVLLLCASSQLVTKIDRALEKHTQIKRALFHEKMDIVERDRQAAWFAEPRGAQILISSEIGGEGRNFQFASKLVLFDLPTHPDLLEQRIGRLDRIGQKNTIEIYVPWFLDTAEQVYFEWYHRGLKSFERAWNGGAALLESLRTELDACAALYDNSKSAAALREAQLDLLIEHTQREVERIERLNRESVDTLIDLNSFNAPLGEKLKRRIEQIDRDPFVRDYMEAMFDHYGVEAEEFDSHGTLKLSAHSLTFVDSFPELPPGSELLATYDRGMALAREDLRLLNQDHPMVKGALSLLLEADEGRVSIAARSRRGRKRQIEFLFVLQATAPAQLEIERYLPVTVLEVVADDRGEPTLLETARDASEELDTTWVPLPEDVQRQLALQYTQTLPRWTEAATQLAERKAKQLIQTAMTIAQSRMSQERARLEELSRVNPSVRAEEISVYIKRQAATTVALQAAYPRLDAIRLVLD